jgi:hypothetical protein
MVSSRTGLHKRVERWAWTVGQLPGGTFQWTTPTGRTFTTEPTRHPI